MKETNLKEMYIVRYTDDRISLYNAQKGKCAVTGKEFEATEEIHCCHITPKNKGGTDEYENLILVTETVHRLIHATKTETIAKLLKNCEPNLQKLKKYFVVAERTAIRFLQVELVQAE